MRWRDDGNRIHIAKDPLGRPAIRMDVPKGKVPNTSFMVAPLGDPGADRACLSVEVLVPGDFDWGAGGGKLGWGLWGGAIGCTSGGCPAASQTGWVQRNVRGSNNGTRVPGQRLYSYHLNRDGEHGEYGAPMPMPKGRWMRIEQEIVMNTPGRADGYARAWVDGKQYGEMRALAFRCSWKWATRGLIVNDMWGGDTSAQVNYSPKSQHLWYSQYKVYR